MNLERKFCPSCQRDKPLEGFELVSTAKKGHKRWKCADCVKKQSTTIYSSKNDTARTVKREETA